MKIKPEHYAILKNNWPSEKAVNYHRQYLIAENKFVNLEKRLRWDCFASIYRRNSGLLQELYAYLNDEHIDTALKKLSSGN